MLTHGCFIQVNLIFAQMRTTSYLLILLFISFLITPTIVTVIKKTSDTSQFYSFAEEELTHKAVVAFKQQDILNSILNFSTLVSALFFGKEDLQRDTISYAIFSPPPNN